MDYPKISVITPSYNQGQFIEETIISVIGQQYPNLEYIILDGGSTDHTVEIIKKYEKHITYWHSKKDNGQAGAINEGFRKSTGDILCWLNSDDTFLSGALHYAANNLNVEHKELLFGNSFHLVEDSPYVHGSFVKKQAAYRNLNSFDYIIQPSSFWTRKLWEQTGELNETLTYVLDWDWFIRAKRIADRFCPTNKYLSVYRIHAQHKTGLKDNKRYEEFKWIYRSYVNDHACSYFVACVENKYLNSMIKKTLSDSTKSWYLNFIKFFYSQVSPRDLLDIAQVVKYNF